MAQYDAPSHTRRLHLSRTNRRLAGVCGGLAEYFGVNATMIRLAWVAVTLMTGFFPGVVGYIAAVILIPRENDSQSGM